MSCQRSSKVGQAFGLFEQTRVEYKGFVEVEDYGFDMDQQTVVKIGALQKRGQGLLDGWKRRYCELKLNGEFLYYKDDYKTELKGVGLFTRECKIHLFPNNPCQFDVTDGNDRVWQLLADTEAQRQSWCEAIKQPNLVLRAKNDKHVERDPISVIEKKPEKQKNEDYYGDDLFVPAALLSGAVSKPPVPKQKKTSSGASSGGYSPTPNVQQSRQGNAGYQQPSYQPEEEVEEKKKQPQQHARTPPAIFKPSAHAKLDPKAASFTAGVTDKTKQSSNLFAVVKEGLLRKRGKGLLASWKLRLCELKLSGEFLYYADTAKTDLKGIAVFDKRCRIRLFPEEPLRFDVVDSTGRIWELLADNQKLRAEWVAAIQNPEAILKLPSCV